MNAQGAAVERRAGKLIFSSLHAGFSLGGLVGRSPAPPQPRRAWTCASTSTSSGSSRSASGSSRPARSCPRRPTHARGARSFARPTRALWALGILAFCCLLAEGARSRLERGLRPGLPRRARGPGRAGLRGLLGDDDRGPPRRRPARRVARLGAPAADRPGLVAGVGLGGALLARRCQAPRSRASRSSAPGSPSWSRSCSAAPRRRPAPRPARRSRRSRRSGYLGFLAGPPLVGGLAELTSLPVALSIVVVCAASTAALAGATRGVGSGDPAPTRSVVEPVRA